MYIIFNGKRPQRTEQGVGLHKEMVNINGWYAGGGQGDVRGLGRLVFRQ